jgi:hypothetical protein
MSEVENIFNTFYSKFILRDFFGKIVPGSILLSSIATSLMSLTRTLKYMDSMSGWMWLFFVGIRWIAGFAV